MRVYVVYILSTIFLLNACKKEQVIPDEFKFIIGEWECVNCQESDTKIVITDKHLKFQSDYFRNFKIITQSVAIDSIEKTDSIGQHWKKINFIGKFNHLTRSVNVNITSKKELTIWPIGVFDNLYKEHISLNIRQNFVKL